MPTLSSLALATLSAYLVGQATAVVTPLVHKNGYTLARPGRYQDTMLTAENTVNSTEPVNFVGGDRQKHRRRFVGGGSSKRQTANLPISLANNFPGSVNAYITGTDESGATVFLGPDSEWFYPQADPNNRENVPVDAASITLSLNGQGDTPLQVTLPSYVISARVYFAASGSLTFLTNGASGIAALVQPSVTNQMDSNYNTNWGFAEFTNTAGGLYINPSQVDFAGLPVGIAVNNNGETVSTPGLYSGAVNPICASLSEQGASDGQPWAATCILAQDGSTLLRALSPNSYRTLSTGAFDGYYDDYVNQVYSTYNSGNPLTIDGSPGGSTCTADGNVMSCTGDEITYNKPNSADIFACDGNAANGAPFANRGSSTHLYNLARLCAGYVRTAFLVDGGNQQPTSPDTFYTTAPTDYYSKFVHANSVDGRGYVFPYDDVNQAGAPTQDGTISVARPVSVTITVGGA